MGVFLTGCGEARVQHLDGLSGLQTQGKAQVLHPAVRSKNNNIPPTALTERGGTIESKEGTRKREEERETERRRRRIGQAHQSGTAAHIARAHY